MTDVWDDIADMLDGVREAGGRSLTSGELAVISRAIEDAVASPGRHDLGRASETLEKAFRSVLASAPPAVKAAVSGEREGSIATAFLLGHLSAAQAIASNALTNRADETFETLLAGGRFEPVALVLHEGNADTTTIAERINLTRRQVLDHLAEMTNNGSVDFRHDGNSIVYFLTPPARAVMEAHLEGSTSPPGP